MRVQIVLISSLLFFHSVTACCSKSSVLVFGFTFTPSQNSQTACCRMTWQVFQVLQLWNIWIVQEALATHAAPRKQGHCAQRCSLLTDPRWDSKLKGSDVNILPSSLSMECLSLYLTLKPHPYSPVMYVPPLLALPQHIPDRVPLSNLTVKNVFGGRNGELRASRDSWWREEL